MALSHIRKAELELEILTFVFTAIVKSVVFFNAGNKSRPLNFYFINYRSIKLL